MPLQPIIQIVLRPIQTSVTPRQTVHFAPVDTVVETFLHVGFVVEIGHLPPVLFVVIVVGVSGVMRGSDGFRVGSGSSVVEVHLRSVGVCGWCKEFLGFFATIGSV